MRERRNYRVIALHETPVARPGTFAPVKTHADAQAGGNPPKQDRSQQRLPTEDEERRHRSDMQEAHENCSMPVNAVRSLLNHSLVAHREISNPLSSYWGKHVVIDIQLETQPVRASAHL